MKKILILHAGGTIGMEATAKGQKALKPTELPNHFLDLVPQLRDLADVEVLVLENMDSSNVTPKHWMKWLQVLREKYDRYDGFVFTHGTDSMTYTGSAFSFALKQTNKPIVFTGSQRPLSHIRTDARDNLINSVELACMGPKEVSLCFGNQLLRANRSTKLSATDYIAFESFNFSHLARIGVDIKTIWKNFSQIEAVKEGAPAWNIGFSEGVFCFKIFPGVSGALLQSTISAPACKGVVLEAYGAGNVPSKDESVLEMIRQARVLKKTVVIVSQCPHGQVDLDLYETGIKAKEAGALSAGDMTSEASVVKLMHGLALGLEREALSDYFLRNICGERSL